MRVPRPCLPPRLRAHVRRFGRSEDGSMVVFGLFIFVMMLIVAGMAVDIMRFETTRTRLQATLDRAVLAAADLDQTRDPEAVVRDYFQSAGLLDRLNSVTVTETINSRSVTADADFRMDTMFMDWAGVQQLDVLAGGTAEEAVNDIEIVLVLDVSGSMVANGSTRLANLQSAARDFVQTVLQNDTENRISIAIVPFNGQVMVGTSTTPPGTVLRDQYNIQSATIAGNAWAYCVDLPTPAYSSTTLSRTTPMPATTYANTWNWASGLNDSNGDMVADTVPNAYTAWNLAANQINANAANDVRSNMWCPPVDLSGNSTAGNVVRLPSRSITGLQSAISGLRGVGATSINAGMRWGLALLDPNSQGMFTALGLPFPGQPYAWGRENTLKIVVLMTDGENFPEEQVNENRNGTGFRSGISPIWRNTNPEGNYSIFHPSRVNRASAGTLAASRPFWVPHIAQWQSRPWNGTSPNPAMPYVESSRFKHDDPTSPKRTDRDGDNDCDNADDGFGTLKSNEACWFDANEQTWPQVWAAQRMTWVAQQLYARPLVLSNGTVPTSVLAGFRAQMDLFRTRTGTIASSGNVTAQMDGQLAGMCQTARGNGVVVYGIAFEVPSQRGRDAIFNCASSASHYYYASTSGQTRNSDGEATTIQAAFKAIAAQINALRLTN